MKRIFSSRSNKGLDIIAALLVVLGASAVFAVRNISYLSVPNFYAEDATVFFQNVYSFNPIETILTPFNGYLVSGLYLLAYIAAAINFIGGGDLVNLPVVMNLVSCLFLGLCASLPFLLFRNKLGTYWSLLAVLLMSLTPMYNSDYAIIGPLGNLKFAFLYIAFLLIVYRMQGHSFKRYVIIDSLLLLCLATNVTVAFLIPFIAFKYANQLKAFIRSKQVTVFTKDFWLALALYVLTPVYVLAALVKGIPEIPGYLEGPYDVGATFALLDRTFLFGWFYPITSFLNDYIVAVLLTLSIVGVAMYLHKTGKTDWFVVLFGLFSAFMGTALFVINRPGIGDYFSSYGHYGGPDQFYYPQNMIITFVVFWMLRGWISQRKLYVKGAIVAGLVVYLIIAIPKGSSLGNNKFVFEDLGSARSNLTEICQNTNNNLVQLQVYPTRDWVWEVNRNLACDGIAY